MDGSTTEDCEICVVGGGLLALYFVYSLLRLGFNKRIIILEAGDSAFISNHLDLSNFEFGKDLYNGVTRGRRFGLGGTSSVWGGNLAEYSQVDVAFRDQTLAQWNHVLDVICHERKIVLKALGVRVSPHNSDRNLCHEKASRSLEYAESLILPFYKRNFKHLAAKILKFDNVQIYSNAIVAGDSVVYQSGGKIGSLSARSRNGNIITVKSRRFILSAGALECTRILLEVGKSNKLIRENKMLGRGLSDHISVQIATVKQGSLTDLLSGRFSGMTLRMPRLLIGKSGETKGFLHVAFEDQFINSFLKQMLGIKTFKGLINFVRDELSLLNFIDLFLFVRDGLVKKKIRTSKRTSFWIQMDLEQEALLQNKICLSSNLDSYGRSIPRLDWTISRSDVERIRKCAECCIAELKEIFPYDSIKAVSLDIEVAGRDKVYDAYHPTGTIPFGGDDHFPLDADLKVRRLDNLWVLSTAVLPSAGAANPTFAILCFANRLARAMVRC